jgi:hypothetical protein
LNESYLSAINDKEWLMMRADPLDFNGFTSVILPGRQGLVHIEFIVNKDGSITNAPAECCSFGK